jgi:hypothetical protein
LGIVVLNVGKVFFVKNVGSLHIMVVVYLYKLFDTFLCQLFEGFAYLTCSSAKKVSWIVVIFLSFEKYECMIGKGLSVNTLPATCVVSVKP